MYVLTMLYTIQYFFYSLGFRLYVNFVNFSTSNINGENVCSQRSIHTVDLKVYTPLENTV